MQYKNGFTLLELLIAAVIIGTLAVFAMSSFRTTASNVRMQDAIARAKVVAGASKRFLREYPDPTDMVDGPQGVMGQVNPPVQEACNHQTLSLQNLVNCGYLEYRQYAREVREGDTYSSNFAMFYDDRGTSHTGWVCVQGRKNKRTSPDHMTRYCTDGETVDTLSVNEGDEID